MNTSVELSPWHIFCFFPYFLPNFYCPSFIMYIFLFTIVLIFFQYAKSNYFIFGIPSGKYRLDYELICRCQDEETK